MFFATSNVIRHEEGRLTKATVLFSAIVSEPTEDGVHWPPLATLAMPVLPTQNQERRESERSRRNGRDSKWA